MTSILMLAYYFPPRGGSGVQRSLKFARYLPDYGCDPVVITVSEDEITETRDNSLLKEIPNVPIYRVSSYERRVKKMSRLRLGPLVSLCLRPDAHILWRKGARQRAAEAIHKHRCRAIYVSVQPWSAAVIGLELKRIHGLPLIVDFRDPWSFSSSLHWPSKWHHRNDCRLEAEVFRKADAIICATPGMIERYQKLYPNASGKIRLILNGFDPVDFPETSRTIGAESSNTRLRIGFAGRLYSIHRSEPKKGISGIMEHVRYRNCEIDFTTHSLAYVVPALQSLLGRRPELRDRFEFHLAGNIPGDNSTLVERAGLSDSFHFHGLLPHRQAVKLIADSDVAYLPMMSENNGQRSWNTSGKIFEYLYNRNPILAAVPDGDAADIVRRARAGWVIDPKDSEGLAKLLEHLIENKRRGEFRVDFDDGYVAGLRRTSQAGQLAGMVHGVVDSS